MKAEEIEALEGYFKTENEHWNGYAFEMLCQVFQRGNFENPETPLLLFSKTIDIFTELYATPLKAVQLFGEETDKQNLSVIQKLFVYEWVLKYVKYSKFEKADINEIKELLISHVERLKSDLNTKFEYNKPLTGNIRDTLKELIQNELEQLPELLKGLDPVQKLNALCKLIPYILPKVESVTHKLGEPDNIKR